MKIFSNRTITRLILAFLLLTTAATFRLHAQTCAPAPVGLVSWYAGDGNALDSRSRNNGTLQNGATFSAGNVGQAFELDGVNDSVSAPDSPSLRPTNLTIEGWFRFDSVTSSNKVLISKAVGTSQSHSYVVFYAPNQPQGFQLGFTTGNGSGINSILGVNFVPTLGQWNHLAFTFDDATDTQTTYINGVLADTNTATNSIGYDSNVVNLGAANNTGPTADFFDGGIDEVSIYNRTLSLSEIQAIFNAGTAGKCKPTATVSPSGQVGWWSGDGNANDIAGTNNGTLQNGAGFNVGKVGQSFNFDGVDDEVEIPDNNSLDFTNAFTMEMWVAPTSVGTPTGSTAFIQKGSIAQISSQSYSILFDSTRTVYNRVGNGGSIDQVNSSTQIPLNTFTHIATSYDGSTLRIYINGVLSNSKPTSIGTLLNTTTPLEIGRGGAFIQAAIDETSLYNRALSDTEIASIFNAGIAGKLKENTTPTGSNVVVNTKSDATVTFPTVSTAGITQQIPLDLSTLPSLPISTTSTGLTYDIATNATFTGSPQVCFNVPSVTTSPAFFNLRILHLESNVWVNRTNLLSINFATRTICTTGLTSLSPFAITSGATTAASVSVGGRVLTADGNGIHKARIGLIDSEGNTRTAQTNPFGYYRFDDVAIGESYVLTVKSKPYQFETPVQSIFITQTTDEINFVALGQNRKEPR